ncbi:hypothetical protein C4564_01550 [Candidatus Microgenomates bacterium]|nr:MAG: hypothetical protein C4564_01550 [Candidatus Microgenomates bacterium]
MSTGGEQDLSLAYFFQGLFVRCGMAEEDAVASAKDFCESIIQETGRALKIDEEKMDKEASFEGKMTTIMDLSDDRVEVLKIQRQVTQVILQDFFSKIKDNLTNEQVVDIAEYINEYHKVNSHT